MLQNETIMENSETGIIRPLIISDRKTVSQYCSSVRHLLFGFEAQEVSCTMVIPPASDIESFLFPRVNIVEHPVLRFPLFYHHNRESLFASVEEIKPGIIHCYGTAKAMLANTLAKHFDLPAVISINSTQVGLFNRQIIGNNFKNIIAPSERVAQGLKKVFPQEKISLVNIGTFVDESCVCFSFPQRVPSMIILGQFNSFKDYEPLLGAIRHLTVDGNDFVVVFMGQGRAERQIRNFINQTGLFQTVSVSPMIRPLRSVLRGCDIFIHSKCFGKFEPAVIEAAGVGLAVAADKDNVEEFLQDGSTAVLFDGCDELSIYSALQKLLDDRSTARTLAINLQNHLRSNNSVSTMVSDLLKIYQAASQQ